MDIVLHSGEITDFFDEAEYFKDEFKKGLVDDESLDSVGDGVGNGGDDNDSSNNNDDYE